MCDTAPVSEAVSVSEAGVRTPLVARLTPASDALSLSVVVPAWNEAFRLPALLTALKDHVDADRTEIIVVDDGSEDGTAAVARSAGDWAPHLNVISHTENRGKGAAVRTGVHAATSPVIGFVDADNATDLEAIQGMIDGLGGDVAAVFGSRHAPGSSVNGSPALRGVMGRVFNHMVRLSAGTTIRDTQCGAKVFQGPAARLAFGLAGVDGFAFDVEVLRLLLMLGFRIEEYPVTWNYVHGTKIRLLTPLRMLRDILSVRARSTPVKIPAIETNWAESVAVLADPLHAGVTLRPGDPCVILCPGVDPGEVQQLGDRVRSAGLWAEVSTRSLTDVRKTS